MADLLIIDDDPADARMLARLLAAGGHDVRTAADAGGALHCLAERQPDLVLLDLALPRVFGLDLLDALRGEPRYATVPVAVFTGLDAAETRDAAGKLGACGYIVKGQDWSATRAQIERCLAETGGSPS